MKKLFVLFIIIAATSCVKDKGQVRVPTTAPKTAYTNILILGNSITYSSPLPGNGWFGNWGMAASAADKDYVHLLTARFRALNPSTTLNAVNISAFETNFDNYDFDANLKSYKDLKPQLIVLRIGENVKTIGFSHFENRYTALINYFKSNNPQVRILAVGSVWVNCYLADQVMSKHSYYISLSKLSYDRSNFAYSLFDDPGIQMHPDDKGMKAISDIIWTAIVKLP